MFNGKHISYWLDSTEMKNYSSLKEEVKVDVAIIGGGIAGITTGFILKKQGFNVALIESNRIVGDVTAGTTAKITITSGLIYSNLLSKFGKDFALKFYMANFDAFNTISNIVNEFNIDCDYRVSPLCLYSSDENSFHLIKDEYDSLEELGVHAKLTDELPYPHKGLGILHDNQGEFHPKKYLNFLADSIEGNGSFVFEKTRVFSIEDAPNDSSYDFDLKKISNGNYNDLKLIHTENGNILANFVVVATNSPIYDPDYVCNFMHQNKSYIMGVYTNKNKDSGMFVDINPFHSYRSTNTDKGEMVIVGGEHHDIGEVEDTWECYKNLSNYIEEIFDTTDIEYFWSNQDNRAVDEVPIIGETSHNGVYIATGFGSWGMTTGTISANVISQLILNKLGKKRIKVNEGKENLRIDDYIDIFDPQRFKDKEDHKDIEECLNRLDRGSKIENSDTYELNDEESQRLSKYLLELDFEEAKIVNIGNHSVAIYKDIDSNFYGVESRSTHIGCTLVWNTAEKSWECPKFGSRFSFNGKVIHGPAIYDLKSYI